MIRRIGLATQHYTVSKRERERPLIVARQDLSIAGSTIKDYTLNLVAEEPFTTQCRKSNPSLVGTVLKERVNPRVTVWSMLGAS